MPFILPNGKMNLRIGKIMGVEYTDRDVLEYLCNQAAASHKTGMQVINDLIREKLAVTV